MKELSMEKMLADGYSRKFATAFLKMVENEKKNPVFDQDYLKWAHERGFSAESASICGLHDDNYQDYLSDYDYNKVWPLNDWTRIWINDKLTLRQVLSDSTYDSVMPRYYYYTAASGIRALMDNPTYPGDGSQFLEVLKNVGVFACKPCNGALAAGFAKLSYENGSYCIDDEPVETETILKFVETHPNYIFTEYLLPAKELAKYGEVIHTCRVITLNTRGNNPEIIGGYIRFPNDESGASNYILHDGTNNDKYNMYTGFDLKTGKFLKTVKTYLEKSEEVEFHPNTGASLAGEIPNYDKLVEIVLGIAKKLCTIEYMGFDIGITDDGVKLMEINSHPGHAIPQIFHPYFQNPAAKAYFEKKLEIIANFTEQERVNRNNLLR